MEATGAENSVLENSSNVVAPVPAEVTTAPEEATKAPEEATTAPEETNEAPEGSEEAPADGASTSTEENKVPVGG
jgi:hypothetical protein